MSDNVSKELRRALDNPATRYRIIPAWLFSKKQEPRSLAHRIVDAYLNRKRNGQDV